MRIGYARVSTVDQDPDYQLRALEESGCERVYTDAATGTKERRPELDRAMEALRPGDRFVVWRFDRLGRNAQHLLKLAAELERREVSLVSLTEGIDTSTPGGRMVFGVFAALAQFERDLTSERTKAAAARKKHRAPWGRRPKMTRQLAAQAKALLADEDLPRVEIARQLGISDTLLYRYFPGGDPDRFTGVGQGAL